MPLMIQKRQLRVDYLSAERRLAFVLANFQGLCACGNDSIPGSRQLAYLLFVLFRAQPQLKVLLQAPCQEFLRLLGNTDLSRKSQGHGHYLFYKFALGPRLPRREPEHQFVEDDAQTENVALERVEVLKQGLWRHVQRRPHVVELRFLRNLVVPNCETEICEFSLAVLIKQDVGRLQVAMHNLKTVQTLAGLQDVDHDSERPGFGENSVGLKNLLKVPLLAVLSDDVAVVGCRVDVLQFDHIFVLDQAQDLNLAQQVLFGLLVWNRLQLNHLYHYLFGAGVVPAQKDLAGQPLADHVFEAVTVFLDYFAKGRRYTNGVIVSAVVIGRKETLRGGRVVLVVTFVMEWIDAVHQFEAPPFQYWQGMKKWVEQYRLDEVIGRGQFGQVYRGYDSIRKETVAVKVVRRRNKQAQNLLDSRQIRLLQNEISILMSIQNPHIVQFIDVKKTPENVYIILQYCRDGTLAQLLKREKRLTEEKAIAYFKQLLQAFRALLELRVVHRDLKPANILLNDGLLKVADFGFSRTLAIEEMALSMLGTPLHMAPQILKQKGYDAKADVWSLGTIFYEMLFGRPPFVGSNFKELLCDIQSGKIKIPLLVNPISVFTQNLLRAMLVVEQKDRISWEDLFKICFPSPKLAPDVSLVYEKKCEDIDNQVIKLDLMSPLCLKSKLKKKGANTEVQFPEKYLLKHLLKDF